MNEIYLIISIFFLMIAWFQIKKEQTYKRKLQELADDERFLHNSFIWPLINVMQHGGIETTFDVDYPGKYLLQICADRVSVVTCSEAPYITKDLWLNPEWKKEKTPYKRIGR